MTEGLISDWIDQPLLSQSRAIAMGQTTAQALMQQTLDRIAARDPRLHSLVHLDSAPAPLVDPDLPLAGLPFGVKDILDVTGQPTRCGSHAHQRTAPQKAGVPQPTHGPADSTAVARLRAAGMVPLAKLATYEYALTGPAWDQPNPPARNPWNAAHITGGSSSGSAAAVAGGLFRVALGTDTGGSIRAPAAYCGIIGLKPTRDAVPCEGCFPLSPSLDVIGPLAACVEDAATVMQILAPGSGAAAMLGQGVAGLTIGYARDWFATDPACHPDVLRAMDDAAALFSQLGARISLISLPDYAPIEAAGTVILQAEAWEVHRDRLAQQWQAYGVDARRNLFTGAALTPDDVTAAWQVARGFGAQVDRHLTQCTALLTPTTLSPAPKFTDFKDGPVWTAMRTLPFNLSGHPAISMPCGFAENGMPLGAQLIGGHGQEAMICRIAQTFEQATPATVGRALPGALVPYEV